MLDIWKEADNLDYGKIIQPPEGYYLRRAIGTTYSLDPSCLLLIPVAMFYSRPMEANLIQDVNRMELFKAIEGAPKVITVFHQKNKIHLPQRVSKLLHYVEGCLVGINQEDHLSSFHPKCWFLFFENHLTKQKKVRFIITSRNLTFDQSWDIVFQMEGDVSDKAIQKNQAFIDFIESLEKKSGNKLESWIKNDIRKSKFRVELPFTDWRFWPIGKESNHPLNLPFKSEQLLMMSPFLDDIMVKKISTKASKQRWLFSRREALGMLKKETLESIKPMEYFCVNERILNGEMDDRVPGDAALGPVSNLDLHAKLFINYAAGNSNWYLGSANLSQPAFERNTECLLELKSNDRLTFPEAIRKLIVSNDNRENLFESVAPDQFLPPELDEDPSQHLRKLEFDLGLCKITGKCDLVAINTDAYKYDVEIDTRGKDWSPDFIIHAKPLFLHKSPDPGCKVEPGVISKLSFPEIFAQTQLSKFFIIKISHSTKENLNKQFLLLCDIEVPATRLSKVFSEVIDSSEKFLKYLMTLLNDDELIESIDTPSKVILPSEGKHENGNPNESFYDVPLYEYLLKSASRNPSKLKSVENAINRMNEDPEKQGLVPDELMEIWKIFKTFVKNEK